MIIFNLNIVFTESKNNSVESLLKYPSSIEEILVANSDLGILLPKFLNFYLQKLKKIYN